MPYSKIVFLGLTLPDLMPLFSIKKKHFALRFIFSNCWFIVDILSTGNIPICQVQWLEILPSGGSIIIVCNVIAPLRVHDLVNKLVFLVRAIAPWMHTATIQNQTHDSIVQQSGPVTNDLDRNRGQCRLHDFFYVITSTDCTDFQGTVWLTFHYYLWVERT